MVGLPDGEKNFEDMYTVSQKVVHQSHGDNYVNS